MNLLEHVHSVYQYKKLQRLTVHYQILKEKSYLIKYLIVLESIEADIDPIV